MPLEKDCNSKQEGAVRVIFEVADTKCFLGCGIRRFNFRLLADLLSHRQQDDVELFKFKAIPKKMFTVSEWKKYNDSEIDEQPQQELEKK
jgi:hypothetical protein